MASTLDRWLATLSRGTIALVAISAGIIFIILADPPHSLCHTQIDFFKNQQKGFLFPDAKDPQAKRQASFANLMEYCKRGNGPGACYELFAKLRIMVVDVATIPSECRSAANSLSELQQALWGPMEFMARTAWGSTPPSTALEKLGWLDVADVNLHCALKDQILRLFGQEDWDAFRERLFRELPGAKDLPRKVAWEKLLLSEDCRRYQ